jgi:hypothetical protein
MAHVSNTVVQPMKSLRCLSVMLMVLLSACDADKAPAPPAKVSAPAASAAPAPTPGVGGADGQKPAPAAASAISTGTPLPIGKPAVEGQAVHELAPNIPTVPVIATGKATGKLSSEAPSAAGKGASASAVTSDAKSAKVKADNAEVARRAPVANKSKAASQVVKETRLNKVPLDLSLPPEMVKQLTPPANVITSASKTKAQSTGAKPLLPKMFPDANADPDFQMQGRLLSNEMDLQLRNEARKDVEGAALDFTFKK